MFKKQKLFLRNLTSPGFTPYPQCSVSKRGDEWYKTRSGLSQRPKSKLVGTGFTLIELLAVMMVLGVIGSIIGSIFFSALRGSSNANKVTLVRQNGNFALSQMAKMIRFASSVDSPFPCFQSTTPPTTSVTSSSLTLTMPDGSKPVFSCQQDTINPLSANLSSGSANLSPTPAPLLDTNVVFLDKTSCPLVFTCSQQSGSDLPSVKINFTLSAKGVDNKADPQTSVQFETTVNVRNFTR